MHQGMMQPSFAFANPANGGWWMTDYPLICLTDSRMPLVLYLCHSTLHCAGHGPCIVPDMVPDFVLDMVLGIVQDMVLGIVQDMVPGIVPDMVSALYLS